MKSEDIAKLAGVSRGTVSRVLNNKPDVAEKTRKKIQDIIDEYGYTPNSSAQKLAGKKVKIIGFFVADFKKYHNKEETKLWPHEAPYFIRFMTTLLGEAKEYKYKTLIDIITTNKECADIEASFKSANISGAIFMGFDENHPQIEKLIKKGYNIALIDQNEFHDGSENLIIANADDRKGAFLATEYLIKKGHKKIVHVAGNTAKVSAKLRIEGYKKALAKHSIEEKPEYLIDGYFGEKQAYEAVKQFLENNKNDLPTAMFFASDMMTVGGIKAIKEAGLKIKDDISIIGYDDYLFPGSFELQFSSIRTELEEMAKFSLKNLIKAIEHEDNKSELIGGVKLIERDSVKIIK